MVKIFYALALIGLVSAVVIDEQCPENEYQAMQTPLCPVTCQNRNLPHCLGLVLKPSCQCAPGRMRDAITKECVPLDECPQPDDEYANSDVITPEMRRLIRESCDSATEIFVESISACPPRCHNGVISAMHCMAIIHKPSCACRSGYVRDTITGHCILHTACRSHLY